MDRGDLFRSCCEALDRLLDGVGADTASDMGEEERALAIIHAARRDHPYTESFWQKYRTSERGNTGGSVTTYHDTEYRPGYIYSTGKDHAYLRDYGYVKKKDRQESHTSQGSKTEKATENK
jgi:hypothetical protein